MQRCCCAMACTQQRSLMAISGQQTRCVEVLRSWAFPYSHNATETLVYTCSGQKLLMQQNNSVAKSCSSALFRSAVSMNREGYKSKP